jgi:uncharacterized protein (TIGR04255 family)
VLKFANPPVVEAWIEFKFDLSDEPATWDKKTAEYFINECFEDFQPDQFFGYAGQAQIKVDAKTGRADLVGAETVFERIRAFTGDRSRCVQGGRNILVFNQMKTDKWPGFEPMREAAHDAVSKYMKFRGLTKLTSVALHYRDVVSVPQGEKGGVRLNDFFTIHPEVPEQVYQSMSGFRFTVQLPEVCDQANTILTIQSLPPTGNSADSYSFAMDWHVTSTGSVESLDSAESWLEKAHTKLRGMFESAFTRQGLELFEPERS